MKCFERHPNYGCQTHSGCNWSLARDEKLLPRHHGQWDPVEDTEYVIGGNTWSASGPLTDDTKARLSKLWAFAAGAKRPLKNRHVIGDFWTTPKVDTIVDQKFVDVMRALDTNLFEFVPHDKVWDPKRKCPPWDGPFYLTSVLQMRPSYDIELSRMIPAEDIAERYRGELRFIGSRRVVRASAVAGGSIWRDTYTRRVLCSEPAKRALESIDVNEWDFYEIEVLDDRH